MNTTNVRVRIAMIEHNVKQYQLAGMMGIHEQSLSRKLRPELPESEQDEIIGIIENIGERKNEPKMYGRDIVRLDGEITDEQIYSDICECLKNAGVLQIGKNKNSAKWVIKACKWEGQ